MMLQSTLATEQMARGTAAGLTKLSDRNMVAAGVGALAQAQADQANRLAMADAEARLRGERDVAAARLAIASAQDREFAIKQQDYLRRAQANANLLSSGIQNVVGGMQNYGMMDLMKQYYGGNDTKQDLSRLMKFNPSMTDQYHQAMLMEGLDINALK